MEILMRAKEANNLKFQFLNPDNPYHQIYKQVCFVTQCVVIKLMMHSCEIISKFRLLVNFLRLYYHGNF